MTGYRGTSYLTALPDIDLQFTANYTDVSPELQYDINFTTTGVYTVWLRGYAPNAAGDSLYISLDDQPATVLSGFAPRQWSWANRNQLQNGTVTITITQPGTHTLYVWQREDGFRLDRILPTTDANYTPTGNGPEESEYVNN